MANNPEQFKSNPENSIDVRDASAERLEELKNKSENSVEKNVESAEKAEAKARHEALESAVSVEAGSAEKKKGGEPSSPVRRAPSKKQKNVAYKKTMEHVQEELHPAERAFSKVIHNRVVEKASDVVGGTVARPNAILSGAVFAFFFTLIFYVVARNFGYSLSGYESISSFVIGWIVGLLYDYFRLLVTGKKS